MTKYLLFHTKKKQFKNTKSTYTSTKFLGPMREGTGELGISLSCAAHKFGKVVRKSPYTSQPILTVDVGIGTFYFLTSHHFLESKQPQKNYLI